MKKINKYINKKYNKYIMNKKTSKILMFISIFFISILGINGAVLSDSLGFLTYGGENICMADGSIPFSGDLDIGGYEINNVSSINDIYYVERNNGNDIQAQIDLANANGGGTIYIPIGLYNINSSITLYAYTHLIGSGFNTIINSTGNFSVFINNDSVNGDAYISIENIKIDGGNITNTNAHGISLIRPSFLYLNNLYIINSRYGLDIDGTNGYSGLGKINNLQVDSNYRGVNLEGNYNNCVWTNIISKGNFEDGIKIVYTRRHQFNGLQVKQNGGSGLEILNSGSLFFNVESRENDLHGIVINGVDNSIFSGNINSAGYVGFYELGSSYNNKIKMSSFNNGRIDNSTSGFAFSTTSYNNIRESCVAYDSNINATQKTGIQDYGSNNSFVGSYAYQNRVDQWILSGTNYNRFSNNYFNLNKDSFYVDGINNKVSMGTTNPEGDFQLDTSGSPATMVINTRTNGYVAKLKLLEQAQSLSDYGMYLEYNSANSYIGTSQNGVETKVIELLNTGAVSKSIIIDSGEISLNGISSDGNGKAVCIKSDGNLGTCSDAVGVSGTCTCS